MIVARNNGSAKKKRHAGIGKLATKLGVDRTHLWRVITGRRVSRALLRRYRGLKKGGSK